MAKKGEKWKVTPNRPLRIGGTIIRISRPAVATINSPHKIKRLRAKDIDDAPPDALV